MVLKLEALEIGLHMDLISNFKGRWRMRYTLILLLGFACGCSNKVINATGMDETGLFEDKLNIKEKKVHTFFWKNWYHGANINNVEFYIDGEKMGNGREGFKNVIEKINTFKNNSILEQRILLDLSIRGPLRIESKPEPYHSFPILKKKFNDLLKTKKIKFKID